MGSKERSKIGKKREDKRFLSSEPFLIPIIKGKLVQELKPQVCWQELGLSVTFHQLDVLDKSSIEEFCDWVKEQYGGIDILVNNAGVNFNIGSENSVEFARMVVDTNYYATKNVTKAMIPLIRASEAGGRIVNVSSKLGRVSGKRNGYWRRRWLIGPTAEKIYVNCYCPGWVKTAMTGWAGTTSAEDGADTGVWLALLPDQAITGKFFAERREIAF
ncbi:unnamed protein product [Linum tenue]|uniref:Uncharacterized protein n=1 Tax=Linum tenue TaxID=586396 RepID=A0AAV0MMM0_9ROSI|nr:unnamed protein product [Linum tenue]